MIIAVGSNSGTDIRGCSLRRRVRGRPFPDGPFPSLHQSPRSGGKHVALRGQERSVSSWRQATFEAAASSSCPISRRRAVISALSTLCCQAGWPAVRQDSNSNRTQSSLKQRFNCSQRLLQDKRAGRAAERPTDRPASILKLFPVRCRSLSSGCACVVDHGQSSFRAGSCFVCD